MRYLAILKDSFREALDSWVLMILIIMSTLVILGLGTFSFKPLPAQAAMEQFFPHPKLKGTSIAFVALNHREINRGEIDAVDLRGKKGDNKLFDGLQLINEYRLEKVELLSGTPDAPESEYALTIGEVFPFPGADEKKHLERGQTRVRGIFQKAEDMGFLKIASVEGSVQQAQDPAGRPRRVYRAVLQGTGQTYRIWAHEPSLFFGAVPIEAASAPLGYQLYVIAQNVLSMGAWVAILAGVVITSFFVPNMLTKGTIEMMLVKPTTRWSIILHKYIGGLSFIFLINCFAVGGMYLLIGVRTGVWAHGMLLLIVTLTFYFAILYAISIYVSIGTRSIIATIIVTIIVWAAFAAVGMTDKWFVSMARMEARRDNAEAHGENRWSDGNMAWSARIAHAVTPRTEELNQINEQITYSAFMTGGVSQIDGITFGDRPWWESILVACAWIVVFLSISCVWFSLKDY